MTPARAVCLAAAFAGALAASAPDTAPPQVPTDYCKGLSTVECLDKLTDDWSPWEDDDWRDWAVPVFAADVNTSSSKCSGMAADIDSTYQGMKGAFASWPKVRPRPLIPEYFFWGVMKPGITAKGFHSRADSVTSRGDTRPSHHMFLLKKPMTDWEIWLTIIHESAHHAGISSEAVAEGIATSGCIKRNPLRERQIGGRGGGGNPSIPVNPPTNPNNNPVRPRDPGSSPGDDCEWTPVWNCRHIFFPKSGYQEIICDPGWAWVCPGDPILASASATPGPDGGSLGYAACAVPDADARRPRSGIRAAE